MGKKISGILGSVRFWQLVVIGVLQALVAVGSIDGATGEAIANAITLILAGSVGIGTIDSAANKLAGN